MLDTFAAAHSDGADGKGGFGDAVMNAVSAPVRAAGEAAAALAEKFALAGESIRGEARITGGVLGGLSEVLGGMESSASALSSDARGTAEGFTAMADAGTELADSARTASGELGTMDSVMSRIPEKMSGAARSALSGMRDEIAAGGLSLIEAAESNGKGIVSATNAALGNSSGGGMRNAGRDAVGGLCQGMESQKPAADKAAENLMNGMVSAAGSVSFTGIGGGVVGGIMKGINEGAPSLMSRARTLATGISAVIGGALRINSPSKVMIPMGQAVTEGMEVGLREGAGSLYETASAISLETAETLGSISTRGLNLSGVHSTNYGDRLDRLLDAVEKLADSRTTMEIDGRNFGRMVREYV